MSRRSTFLAVAIAAVVPLGAATSAHAAPPMPFTITEDVLAGTFTATGPICSSGTFMDDLKVFAGHPDKTGQANIVQHTVYSCDNGSGSFNALKVQHLTFSESGL